MGLADLPIGLQNAGVPLVDATKRSGGDLSRHHFVGCWIDACLEVATGVAVPYVRE